MTITLSRRVALAAVVGGAVAATGLAAKPAEGASTAVIYVVQGVADTAVDVKIDGRTVASGVRTAAVAGPFTVRSGTRTVSFVDGDKTLDEKKVSLRAGSNSDLVLHLPVSASEGPMTTVFPNDLSAVPAGKAAVAVAHTAAVPPADIRVNGDVLFENVANGESLYVVVPAGTYEVDIVPTGKSSPVVLGPLDLAVKGGSLNRVYAVGNPEDKTMNVAAHVIALAASGSGTPNDVNTGTGGQAADLDAVYRHFGRTR